MNSRSLLTIMIVFWLVYACSFSPEVNNEVEETTIPDSGIILNAEAVKIAGIKFGIIESKLLSHDVNARGQIQLLPQKVALVSVMVAGAIQSINVNYGQIVRKGDVLATYSSHEFLEMQQLYLNAKTNLEKIQKDFERQQSLWDKKVISEKEFQQASSDFHQAKVDFKASEAEMSLLHIDLNKLNSGEISKSIPIVSPIDGQVEGIQTTIGQFVSLGDQIFKVIDKSEPVLQLMIFEKDIHLIQNDQRVNFTLPRSPTTNYEATIFNVGSTVEQNARIVHAYASIKEGPKNLVPGMFVSSTIHTSEQMRFALPESAVVVENDNKKYGFYTLDDDSSSLFRFYPIFFRSGYSEEGFVEVWPEYKIPEHARFVISGTYYLKSELMKMYVD